MIDLFKEKLPTKDEELVTAYLLTKHLFLNSLAATSAYELKEYTKVSDKRIYSAIRQELNVIIKRSQELHDRYLKVIPNDTMFVWEKLDELNKLIDENLLKK